ncbi:Magnesium transporter MRS2-3, partial [Quillaja saponaria]
MLPVALPPTVQRNSSIPACLSSNRSILMFIPKIAATTTKALTTRVAVVKMTPICRRWFCLSSSIML